MAGNAWHGAEHSERRRRPPPRLGFEGEQHIPNGMIFTIGMWSMILAPGVVTRTLLTGRTTSGLGAIPNEHSSVAPQQTCMGIMHLSRESLRKSAARV